MSKQYATFYLEDRLYGIDVMKVQEVAKPLPITVLRTAPNYVRGLINLRGQIATAIGLRELFGISSASDPSSMTVVCRADGNLLSFLVDRIGDVLEVEEKNFEPTPDTINDAVKTYMGGVYKSDGEILSVIEIESISKELSKKQGE